MIKKRYKILLASFLFFAFLLTSVGLMLSRNHIQTKLLNRLLANFSSSINAQIKIGKVSYSFFNHITLRDIYIEGQDRDTIVAVKKLELVLKSLSLQERIVCISKAIATNADIQFSVDSSGVLNIQFLIDLLTGGEASNQPKWVLDIKKIRLDNCKYRIAIEPYKEKDYGVNYSYMQLHDLYATVRDLYKGRDAVTRFEIYKLTFKEQSGLVMKNFSSNFLVNQQRMEFSDVRISTPYSRMAANNILFSHADWKDWGKGGFISKVNMHIELTSAEVRTKDLSYFVPIFNGYDHEVKLSGRFNGTVNNLKGKNIVLSFQKKTYLEADLHLTGLPDLRHTFIYHNIKSFSTTYDDLLAADLGFFTKQAIHIPEQIQRVGLIKYKGNFTGFIDDFVAYGQLKTDAGNVFSDIAIVSDSAGGIRFNGNITTTALQMGHLFNTGNNYNNLSMTVKIKGVLTRDNSIDALVEGKVLSVSFYDYLYSDIHVNGIIKGKTYEGKVIINDPNLDLDFSGRFDFSRRLPEFDFHACINKANLFALHIDKSDSLSMLNCEIKAMFFAGDSINLNGEIQLTDAFFTKTNKELAMNDFFLYVNSRNDTDNIIFRSDYVDASLNGKFNYASIFPSFKKLLAHYLPSEFPVENIGIDTLNGFSLSVNMKNTKPISDFFMPHIGIADNTVCNARFIPHRKLLNISGYSDRIRFFGNQVLQTNFRVYTDSLNIISEVKASDCYFLTKRLNLKNFLFTGLSRHDSMLFKATWHASDSILFTGDINALAVFSRPQKTSSPVTQFVIRPSVINYNDSIWHVQAREITLDTTSIAFTSFLIQKHDESFYVNGKISENPEDLLRVEVNLDLSKVNVITKEKGFEFEGTVKGHSTLVDFYCNPCFEAELSVDTLFFNQEKLGSTRIESRWVHNEKKLEMNVSSSRGLIQTLLLSGDYYPETKNVDIDIMLNKLRLHILNPYLKGIVSDIRGMGTGTITMKGNISDPQINGSINLQKTAFTVNYINTRYSFTHELPIKNNSFLLNNISLYDSEGNKARIDGFIQSSMFFKQWYLDFALEAKKLLALHTNPQDNEYFYGKAYVAGVMSLQGSTKDLSMKIALKSQPNSQLFIPLTSGSNISELGLLSFAERNKEKKIVYEERPKETIDLSGFALNFDLELTPDLSGQIIFDPQTGDIIRCTGYGNIKIDVTNRGNFRMYGKYHINDGDYLFTLQNLINKRFTIQQGSYLSWNGDPVDAEIEMNAIYKLKASLSSLFGDTTQTYKRRIPVDCNIHLSGKLLKPEIQYSIMVPTVDPEIQNRFNSLMINEDKRSIQFLSLLVFNNFYPDPDYTGQTGFAQNSNLGAVGGFVTTTEMLSNQLSNWLSAISKDIDIALNYRPANEINTQEIELALSTHLLSDRVSITGNLDMGGQQTTDATGTSNIVGDFIVDVKIHKSGKLRLKAFNRSNDKLLYENSRYTQGVGIQYREEFDRWDDLLIKYRNIIFGRNRRN